MPWRKLGRLYGGCHCQLPVVLSDLTVLVTDRDAANRSRIVALRCAGNPPAVVGTDVVLEPGEGFDRDGVMTACVVEGDTRRLYYTGWRREGARYRHAIGLAEDRGYGFRRVGCVLASGPDDHYLCSSPFVSGGRMWYVSGRGCGGWVAHDGKEDPVYSLRYAESADGLCWRSQDLAIERAPLEIFARPFVRGTEMWTTHLTLGPVKRYRIGYATSADGLAWTRRDGEAGITVSDDGWDSEMVAFPWLFWHGGQEYMVYSGNGFGRDGCGLAVRS